MTVVVGLVGAILGSLVGGFITYLTTRLNMRLTLEHTYDQAIQNKRIERYQSLFQLTGYFPRYWPPHVPTPTREDLRVYNDAFRNWYFGEGAGGMFLTPAAQEQYMRLRNVLAEIAFKDFRAPSTVSPEPLSPEEAKILQALAIELRRQLTEDVGAAHPPRIKWTRPEPLPPAPELHAHEDGQSAPDHGPETALGT
ncbi:hypothetical protein AB0I30_29675 [Nocardia tengchongensis]|uniref:hypothetical protein n=1 Tax=Nocardia tengchongensis TaxID=2055889 RepID=UPI00340912DC